MNPDGRYARALRAVTVLAVAVSLVGCGAGSGPRPGRTGTTTAPRSTTLPPVVGPAGVASVPAGAKGSPQGSVPAAARVDGHNPDAVAHAYVVTAWTSDTRIDRSPNDGARRARAWMTSQLWARYATPLPGDGGAPWVALVAAGGYTSVIAVLTGDPEPGTAYRVTRTLAVTVTEHTGKGKPMGTPQVFMVSVTLTRDVHTAPWRVMSVSAGT